MKLRVYISILSLLVLIACAKTESENQSYRQMKVLDDLTVINRIAPGIGQFLISGGRLSGTSCYSNGFEELWEYSLPEYDAETFWLNNNIWDVVLEPDGSFSVFLEEGSLVRLSPDGETEIQEQFFLEGLEIIFPGSSLKDAIKYIPIGIKRISNGNYVAYGYLSGLRRAFISLHSANGDQLSLEYFVYQAPEINGFSDLVELDDGSLLALGSHASASEGDSSRVFLVKMDGQGKVLGESLYAYESWNRNDLFEYAQNYFYSRSLLINANGGYTMVLNRPDPSSEFQFVEFVHLNDSLVITDSDTLAFTTKNYSYLNSMSSNRSGTAVGVINQNSEIVGFTGDPASVQRPHFAYTYFTDQEGHPEESSFISDSRINYINNVEQLSDGSIIYGGSLQSMNGQLKGFVLIKE